MSLKLMGFKFIDGLKIENVFALAASFVVTFFAIQLTPELYKTVFMALFDKLYMGANYVGSMVLTLYWASSFVACYTVLKQYRRVFRWARLIRFFIFKLHRLSEAETSILRQFVQHKSLLLRFERSLPEHMLLKGHGVLRLTSSGVWQINPQIYSILNRNPSLVSMQKIALEKSKKRVRA